MSKTSERTNTEDREIRQHYNDVWSKLRDDAYLSSKVMFKSAGYWDDLNRKVSFWTKFLTTVGSCLSAGGLLSTLKEKNNFIMKLKFSKPIIGAIAGLSCVLLGQCNNWEEILNNYYSRYNEAGVYWKNLQRTIETNIIIKLWNPQISVNHLDNINKEIMNERVKIGLIIKEEEWALKLVLKELQEKLKYNENQYQ